MALSGAKAGPNTLLLAGIADSLNLLLWSMTKDGQKGKNRPSSILNELTGRKRSSMVQGFMTGEDFDKAKHDILKSLAEGGD